MKIKTLKNLQEKFLVLRKPLVFGVFKQLNTHVIMSHGNAFKYEKKA